MPTKGADYQRRRRAAMTEEQLEAERVKRRERERRKYAEDPEYRRRVRERQKIHYGRPTMALAHRIKRFGLTVEQYDSLLADQNMRCAICRSPQPGGRAGWHVDFHEPSGEVKGLLCHWCRAGIGAMRESVSVLQLAIRYLKRTRPQ